MKGSMTASSGIERELSRENALMIMTLDADGHGIAQGLNFDQHSIKSISTECGALHRLHPGHSRFVATDGLRSGEV